MSVSALLISIDDGLHNEAQEQWLVTHDHNASLSRLRVLRGEGKRQASGAGHRLIFCDAVTSGAARWQLAQSQSRCPVLVLVLLVDFKFATAALLTPHRHPRWSSFFV